MYTEGGSSQSTCMSKKSSDDPDADPSTKKKKLTKAEKEKAVLEKKTDVIRNSGEPFTYFVRKMEEWLALNAAKAIAIFRRVDSEGLGAVTYDEFKAGLMDLLVPCNKVELHLLCQLFDPEKLEEVDYLELNDGLKHVRSQEENYRETDVRPVLVPTFRNYDHCPCCKMPIWDGQSYQRECPRFIEVLLRFITFESFKKHPGHFSLIVHSHITVLGLIKLIKDHTQILTTKMAVFTDKSRDVDSMLPLHSSLEECGFKGGSQENPEELLLFYDYAVEFTDCPLLLSDHYFGRK